MSDIKTTVHKDSLQALLDYAETANESCTTDGDYNTQKILIEVCRKLAARTYRSPYEC